MTRDMPSNEELVTFSAGGLEWTAEAATADAVREQIASRLDDLESVAGASVIKRNLVRAVYRAPLAELGQVIVKRYAVGGLIDWVKYSFKPSRAKAEWNVGRALHAAGIATAVPLAMAEDRRGVLRDAALVTREIRDAVHLNAYVETNLQGDPVRDALRARFYDDLARTVRRVHEAGFVHNDLHGGNLLVTGPPDEPRIHVIDLHSVTRGKRAGARFYDLLKLLHSMLTCSTAEERRRICAVYESAGDGASGTCAGEVGEGRPVAVAMEQRLAAMERKRVRSRTKRAMTVSSRFDRAAVRGYSVRHVRATPACEFVDVLARHRETLDGGGANVLKDARRSALTRQTLSTAAGARRVVVKQYRCTHLGERVKNLVRRPRAIAAWIAGNGLLVRNFEAAEPLALVTRGRGLFMSEAYVIMADAGDGARLDLVALDRFAGELDAEQRAEKHLLLDVVADVVARLHASGVYHSDLKAVNVFLDESRGRPAVVLADYDRVEFDQPVWVRRRVKNLAQLSASIPICISLADRLRFFRRYARNEPQHAADWKVWFRGVVERCRQKIVVRMKPIE